MHGYPTISSTWEIGVLALRIRTMKRLLIFVCSILSLYASAQVPTTYIIGKFKKYNGDENFITKVEGFGNYENSMFLFTSVKSEYVIVLCHYVYDDRTDNPVVLDMAISSLENLDNIIQAEDLLKFKDSDSAYKWMLEQLDNKTKLYIIDTNNFYKSDPTLTEPDRMKVFEVRVFYAWIPDHILNLGDWGFGS